MEYERFVGTKEYRSAYGQRRKRYGFWKFMGDSTMVAFTGGLWLVWIFVREMRNR